jgi:hypothetical protein
VLEWLLNKGASHGGYGGADFCILCSVFCLGVAKPLPIVLVVVVVLVLGCFFKAAGVPIEDNRL